ncbi:ShlB/FhaC/HecB family hemolysin secretion/activation protein [Pelistega sp. NLN82]|uniref:ShlB/FhaC/HecB family hemolysin secretion/activation protein n=1 Tax=Pelistega ratti TaxID=2652177 RepID=A0A6L9Y5G0_9BURK|nr:ShlB/FhaC/HecB family hemolysin secretion/activation protein [Pelistega ratti]NEN75506.1 ShlB/FhaC/HecB family hemolysin secretion/activation protein [Pelistega ratti]
MKYSLIWIACVPAFVWANNTNNTSLLSLQNEFNRFQQETKYQNEQLQQTQQQRWIEQHQYQAKPSVSSQTDLSQVCLPYNTIQFKGFTLIDPIPFAPKANECLNEARLNQLSQDITAAYLALGYVHNPFHFEVGSTGQLIMRVTEGKISQFSSNSQRLNFSMLLPQRLGKPLNIKDLDQALDQANKMAGSKVSVDVLPAKNGKIELAFLNEEKARITGHLGLDNTASKRTGRWQVKGGLNIDSPLGLSDSLYLNASHTLKSYRQNVNRSFSFFHTIPYGYWTFSTFGSYSAFKSTIPLRYFSIDQRGYTWQAAIRSDYTFRRNSNAVSTLYTQLERIKSKSYLLDSLITLQSPTLTTAQIGINHLQLFPNGSLIADISYERGLKWWNAMRNQGRDQPQGQFNRWRTEWQLTYFYRINAQLFRQSSRLVGQYSRHYLPAIKQADLMGRYAVRGFNDFAISAEKSVVLQNNIAWLYPYKQGQIEPYIGIDIGIQKTTAKQAKSQKALAYVLGVKMIQPHWQIQVEWGTGRLFLPNHPIIQERSVTAHLNLTF